MRIAYIAPYQGPSLLNNRPIVGNLSLAGTQKIELIARLLQSMSYEVEIISQGEVIGTHWRYFPSIYEQHRFHPDIPVFYSSALAIRYMTGLWESHFTLQQFISRHHEHAFDLVIIYNMKLAQIACATHALRKLALPVILEYEDDVFLGVDGRPEKGGLRGKGRFASYQRILNTVSGCMAASPFLLSRVPPHLPGFVLRGIIGGDILKHTGQAIREKRNRVLFSGTHTKSKGIEQLINAWKIAGLTDWELHITGHGILTDELRHLARDSRNIVFHGLIHREQLVRLLCSAKICINPHDLSQIPGNVFAFKIIEYLAAGAHVITTPMGPVDHEMERGITYMPDNDIDTIVATLKFVIREQRWEQTAMDYVHRMYGPENVSKSLDFLIRQAVIK